MNNDDEVNEEFLHQMSSNYGQVESVLGTDGYEAFLQARRTEQKHMLAHAELTQSISFAIRWAVIVGMLMAMPVIVWLWKWAI